MVHPSPLLGAVSVRIVMQLIISKLFRKIYIVFVIMVYGSIEIYVNRPPLACSYDSHSHLFE